MVNIVYQTIVFTVIKIQSGTQLTVVVFASSIQVSEQKYHGNL